MDEHKKFLADRLLSEERPVTYRLLSRALDVHVNTAKSMLYDFHQYQNSLRENSVCATYLLYGVKAAKSGPQNGDVEMSSSMPEPEALSEAIPTKTLTLVGEENLDDILHEYQEVTSIHIYSLAPPPQRDLAQLADMSMSISEQSKKGGSVLAGSNYGAIPNPQVRRRQRQSRPALAATDASKPVKQEPVPAKPPQAIEVKQETAKTPSADTPLSSHSGKKNTAPTMNRGGSGGIMQSFAKAASKPPPKPKPAVKEEDSAMALSDDGEADDADMPRPKQADTDADATKKGRKEREEELRRMMDEDDNDAEPDATDAEPDDEEMEEAPEPELGPEADAAPDTGSGAKSSEDKGPAEVLSSSGDGRRRGKRRIMQKKRILDDQGYMVTIQEAGWESFSEDETPQPAAKKKATPTSTPVASGTKAKRTVSKSGQGNIMSFFSKK